jgi:hypothetical protein
VICDCAAKPEKSVIAIRCERSQEIEEKWRGALRREGMNRDEA